MNQIAAIVLVAVALGDKPTATPQEQLREALLSARWGYWSLPAQDLQDSFESPEEFVSSMASFLDDENPRLRAAAADVLGRLGPRAVNASDRLVQMLRQDDDSGARYMAAGALGRLKGADALQHLLDALEDKSPRVRSGAHLAIGRLGDGAADAVPALRKSLKDREMYSYAITPDMADQRPLCYEAAMALGHIGQKAVTALPDLRQMLQDGPDEMVGCAVAFAIARIDTNDSSGVAYLADVLKEDGSEFASYQAARRLGDLGKRARAAVPAIIFCLRHDEGSLPQLICVEILPKVNGTGEDTVSLLVSALADDHTDVQGEVLLTLRKMGSDARSAAPSVSEFLRNILHEEIRYTLYMRDMRAEAIRTVLAIADVPTAISVLVDILREVPNEKLRSDILKILEKPRRNTKELIAELEKRVSEADPAARVQIQEAIKRMRASEKSDQAQPGESRGSGR